LEVLELTGKPISEWQQQWGKSADRGSKMDPATSLLPPRILCLDIPRADLYARIESRVSQMIAEGFVEEVRALRNLARPVSKEAAQALGYKEMFAFLDGQMTLGDTILRIQTRSRNLAKRQLTWFRHLADCQMVSPELTFSLWGLKINGKGNTIDERH
jgi:tRNA dimethylallyltransferase